MARIWNLAVKEFIQLIRDRMMAAFLILLPLAQLVLLAQATGQRIGDLPLAVLDRDRTAQSRGLIQALSNIPDLAWRYQAADEEELTGLIDRGEAAVGVVIPPGFAAALAGRAVLDTPPALQVIVDGSNSVAGGTGQAAAEATIGDYLRRQAPGQGAAVATSVTLYTSVRYNPQLNSRLYTIPAQMGFIIYQITLAVASLVFARERELGTLEQLLVTPIRRIELISGKAMMAWLVGLLDFLLMYVVVTRGYAVPMRGSFGLLLALSMLFVTVEIGYGVIISSASRTQQQAVLYVFMLAMLDVALSGYLVPVKNMPAFLRLAAEVSPMQHYLVIIRAIMLKGADLATLWPQVAALAGIGLVAGLLALATATRSLD
ncbi:MAG TPA: ABC transporter permease [Anaerolineae bacterium]